MLPFSPLLWINQGGKMFFLILESQKVLKNKNI